jgi:ferredoxin
MQATLHTLYWLDKSLAFRPGETIAAALRRAGIDDLGAASGGLRARYFCGIGSCQACLVSVDGAAPVEACLTPAAAGMRLSPGLPPTVLGAHD